jgi:hypothetical protein
MTTSAADRLTEYWYTVDLGTDRRETHLRENRGRKELEHVRNASSRYGDWAYSHRNSVTI